MIWRRGALWAGLLVTGVAMTGCASGGRRVGDRGLNNPSTPMASASPTGSPTQSPGWNNPPVGRSNTPGEQAGWANSAQPNVGGSGIQQVSGTSTVPGTTPPTGVPMNSTPSESTGNPNRFVDTSQFNPPGSGDTSGSPGRYPSEPSPPPKPLPANVTNSDRVAPLSNRPQTESTPSLRTTSPPPPPQFADDPPVSQAPPPPTPAAWETPPIAVKTSGNPGPSAPAPPPPSQAGSN